jgi:hypothetical protein
MTIDGETYGSVEKAKLAGIIAKYRAKDAAAATAAAAG